MRAAIVNSPGAPPEFGSFSEPSANEGEVVIKVTAAPLTPITKLIASGKHYAGGADVGFVPGVDGVGVAPDGRRFYFLFPKAPFGSMAERSLANTSAMVPVPDDLSDERAAAVATAGVASWLALTRRAKLERGQTVLIAGATGAAGEMAVQVARHLGAGKVIALGREEERLSVLDAEVKIVLDGDADDKLRAAFDERVDIVLDFVWGQPAERVLVAAATRRGARTGEPRLRHVVLGTMAGNGITITGDMLRGSGLELLGSGIGAVSVRDLLQAAQEVLVAAPKAGFNPSFESVPLEKINTVWAATSGVRYVVRP